MNKEYEVTQKVTDLMTKSLAHEKLRDIYVKLPFMHKRAVKSAYEAERFRVAFWSGVFKLYPNLKGNTNLTYMLYTQIVTENETQ